MPFKQSTPAFLSTIALGFSLAQWFFLRSTALLALSPFLLVLLILFSYLDYKRYKGR